jgi:hypothetical protein
MALINLPAPPTAAVVKDELIGFWDGFVLLNKGEINQAYSAGKTLGDLGMLTDDAEACTNKYNSLILRGNGRGPLVSAQLARDFLSKKMTAIVDLITKRAQP